MFASLEKRMNKFWNSDQTLAQSDPEFVAQFNNFAYGMVLHEPAANPEDLSDTMRSLLILATLVGCRGIEEFESFLPVAFSTGVSAVSIKEMLYEANGLLGLGRVLPFLTVTNETLHTMNIHMPLPSQAPISTHESLASMQTGDNKDDSDAISRGKAVMLKLFGRGITRDEHRENENTDCHRLHGRTTDSAFPEYIHEWQSQYYGELYSRSGLSIQQREILAFSLLSASAASEAQIHERLFSNLRAGNSLQLLQAVVAQCLPYLGFSQSQQTLSYIACYELNDTSTDEQN